MSIKNHVLENGMKIGKAIVTSNKLLKKGSCIQGTTINPTSITFHQTACIDVEPSRMHLALTNANNDPHAGTDKSNYRKASWTVTIGHDAIVQNVPFNWRAIAQGNTQGNNTSISVEMCMYTDKNKQYQTYLNAIEFYKFMIKNYNKNLVAKSHYDWSKKNCPQWLRENKYGYSWGWFKEQLTTNSNPSASNTVVETVVNQTGLVKATSLNVRKGAGTGYSVIGKLSDNTKVNVVAKCSNNWLKIQFNGGYGYVSGDYIDNIVNVVSEFKVRITCDNLNIRSGAGTNHNVVGQVHKNQAFTIVEESNNFGKLKSGAGWISVSNKYVNRI